MALLAWLRCLLGWHRYIYRREHWYGHLVGRCWRCGRLHLPEMD